MSQCGTWHGLRFFETFSEDCCGLIIIDGWVWLLHSLLAVFVSTSLESKVLLWHFSPVKPRKTLCHKLSIPCSCVKVRCLIKLILVKAFPRHLCVPLANLVIRSHAWYISLILGNGVVLFLNSCLINNY